MSLIRDDPAWTGGTDPTRDTHPSFQILATGDHEGVSARGAAEIRAGRRIREHTGKDPVQDALLIAEPAAVDGTQSWSLSQSSSGGRKAAGVRMMYGARTGRGEPRSALTFSVCES